MTDRAQLLQRLHRGAGQWCYWTLPDRRHAWHEAGQDAPPPIGEGVYFGVNVFGASKRGNSEVAAVNALYADFDAKGHGDDMAATLAHALAAPLPPSVIVCSGGGYHAYWLLRDTFTVADDDARARIIWAQDGWVDVVGADRGAHDIARILRTPGTLNRKYTPPRECHIEAWHAEREYTLDELETVIEAARPRVIEAPRPAAQERREGSGRGVIEAYNRAYSLFEVAGRYGYTFQHNQTRFTRPGKAEHDGISGIVNTAPEGWHTLYSFSGNDKLQNGHQVDAFDVFNIYEHGGDKRAATKAAAALLGMAYARPVASKNGHGEATADDDAPAVPEPEWPAQDPNEVATGATMATVAPGAERVRIRANGRQLRDVSADAIAALARAGSVFVRSGLLVRVTVDERGDAGIVTLNESALRGELERAADFYTQHTRRDGEPFEKPTPPPLDVVRDVLALGTWPLPALAGVIESPAMRPDGSLLTAPGYDVVTKLYYYAPPGFELGQVPGAPTRADAAAALAKLRDVFVDFPFSGDASRDNTIGTVLALVARPMIDGPAPLAVYDAPQQGTGKTLLAQVSVLLANGRLPALGSAPTNPEEWDKRLGAQLGTGQPYALFDNVTDTIESGPLAAVITADTYEFRRLAANTMIRLPAQVVFMVTGNNVRVGGDMVRRCYVIRLDAESSNPWQREGFKYSPLADHIRANRGGLLAAALCMVRAWVVAGRPGPVLAPQVGSFERWRHVVGGTLEYAGATNFLGNLREFYETADAETPVWESFIAGMAEVFGDSAVSTGQVFERCLADEKLGALVPDDLAGLLSEATKPRFTQRLAYALRERKGKRHGATQARVEVAQDGKKRHSNAWQFIVQKQGGF